MKRTLGVLAVTAMLASCGSSNSDTTNNADSSAKVGTDSSTLHTDSSHIMADTTHKDSVVH